MITFKQFKQKLMTDLKQRVIKDYTYDKKANNDIHYHLNFGEQNKLSKKSRDEVLIEMMFQIRDDILNQMHQGFNTLNKRMDKLEARMEQLENQATIHGWNIKRI